MSQPAISVIVPIYNCAPYLEKCLSSVAEQTVRNVEVLLINDGSTDESPEIAQKYVDLHLSWRLLHQDRKGPSAARNIGLSIAKGKYIAFVDADDYIDKEMLACMLTLAEKQNSDIVVCDYRTVLDGNCSDPVLGEIAPIYNQNDLFFCQFARAYVVWNKLFRHAVIEKSGAIFRDTSCEDYPFCLDVYPYLHKISGINKPLYYYVQRPASIMHQAKPMAIQTTMLDVTVEEILPSWETVGIGRDLIHAAFFRAFSGLLYTPGVGGQPPAFFQRELSRIKNWEGFPEFTRSLLKTDALTKLCENGAVGWRFYHLSRQFFRLLHGGLDTPARLMLRVMAKQIDGRRDKLCGPR